MVVDACVDVGVVVEESEAEAWVGEGGGFWDGLWGARVVLEVVAEGGAYFVSPMVSVCEGKAWSGWDVGHFVGCVVVALFDGACVGELVRWDVGDEAGVVIVRFGFFPCRVEGQLV